MLVRLNDSLHVIAQSKQTCAATVLLFQPFHNVQVSSVFISVAVLPSVTELWREIALVGRIFLFCTIYLQDHILQ